MTSNEQFELWSTCSTFLSVIRRITLDEMVLQDLQWIDIGYFIFHYYPLGQDKWSIMYKFPVKDITKCPVLDNW